MRNGIYHIPEAHSEALIIKKKSALDDRDIKGCKPPPAVLCLVKRRIDGLRINMGVYRLLLLTLT